MQIRNMEWGSKAEMMCITAAVSHFVSRVSLHFLMVSGEVS